jgi:hypothetical protein
MNLHPAPELSSFIVLTEVAEGWHFAEPIFRKKYAAPAPHHGRHLLAWYRDGERWIAASYLNYLPFRSAMLIGGACTDGRVLRGMSESEQSAVALAGGLMRQLVCYGEQRFAAESVGTFGHCGDMRSWSVLSSCGYRRLDDPHLIVRWNREPEGHAREQLLSAIRALGAF